MSADMETPTYLIASDVRWGSERRSHSSPLYVQQSRTHFSALCAAEQCTLLCFMCSRAVHTSPLYVQRSSACFSALCAAEQRMLLHFMCSGAVHSSPLCVQ